MDIIEIARRHAKSAVEEMGKGYVFVEDFGLEIIERSIRAAFAEVAEQREIWILLQECDNESWAFAFSSRENALRFISEVDMATEKAAAIKWDKIREDYWKAEYAPGSTFKLYTSIVDGELGDDE